MPGYRLPEPIPHLHDYPALATLNMVCRSLSLVQRKEVMTAVRVGLAPRHSRRLRREGTLTKMREVTVDLLDEWGNRRTTITMHDVWTLLDSFLTTPMRRSLLSMALRCSPINEEEAASAISSGIEKELAVTQRQDLLPTLRYPFFISQEDCRTTRIHPDVPFNPIMSLRIRHRFLHLREVTIPRLLLIPQVSFKNIGIESSEEFWAAVYPDVPSWQRPTGLVTTSDLESLYAERGQKTGGPCEVRYAWKYNDLKPRIYYAIGGSAFHAAKYIKPIFDAICKMSRSTDPAHRYSFAGFPLVDFSTEVFIVYDYASFTSRLVDFKQFVSELAWFLKGRMVKIFDTNTGMKEEDVGLLLQHYNDTCNVDGEYSLTKLSSKPGEAPTRVLCNHYVAGMLGVFGNIVGSTSLHGIVGLHICGADEQGNFIGDDAGIVCADEMDGDRTWIFEGIRAIGEIADPKFEIFEANDEEYDLGDSWHYTKRPVKVTGGAISQGWMPEFPILASARGQRLDHVTTSFPTILIRRRIFIRQVTRYLNSCYTHRTDVNEADRGMILSIFRKIYAELRLPRRGSFPRREFAYWKSPSVPYGDPYHVVPPLDEEVFEKGWWKVLMERGIEEQGTMRLPVFHSSDELPPALEMGMTFRFRADRVLSLLAKIGVVSRQIEYEDRLVTDETLELMDLYLSGSLKPVYTYYVHEDYHPWSSYFELL